MADARVIIIGGGFAGIAAARKLSRRAGASVLLIDRRSESHFLPMLPDLIGRPIRPRNLMYPLASLRRPGRCEVVRDDVREVDTDRRIVRAAGRTETYDFLVIAAGSRTNFRGRDDLAAASLKLDEVEDGLAIREAMAPGRRDAYVVCGGGYTGVEIATNLWRAFRRRPSPPRIALVEYADGLCKALTAAGATPAAAGFQEYIQDNVASLGIEVILNATVDEAAEGRVRLSNGRTFDRAGLIWTAGVRTPDFVQAMDAEKAAQGRIVVDEFLRLDERTFVTGDCAAVVPNRSSGSTGESGGGSAGQPIRMSVQFGLSEGSRAAGNILRAASGRELRPFRPRDPGWVVPMANFRSCGVALGLSMRGRLPTLMHYVMCVLRSWGVRNRAGLLRDLLGPKPRSSAS